MVAVDLFSFLNCCARSILMLIGNCIIIIVIAVLTFLFDRLEIVQAGEGAELPSTSWYHLRQGRGFLSNVLTWLFLASVAFILSFTGFGAVLFRRVVKDLLPTRWQQFARCALMIGVASLHHKI